MRQLTILQLFPIVTLAPIEHLCTIESSPIVEFSPITFILIFTLNYGLIFIITGDTYGFGFGAFAAFLPPLASVGASTIGTTSGSSLIVLLGGSLGV
jgi:hypothetical protein